MTTALGLFLSARTLSIKIKRIPVATIYLDESSGIKRKLLDVHKDINETAAAIFTLHLLDVMKNNDINASYVVAYGADNASVNYGKRCSVYTKILLF